MKETYSVYDHLEILQKRPAMYVGAENLRYISVYLIGYQAAMREAGIRDKSEPAFNGFREFVRTRYHFPGSSRDWPDMILAVTIGLDPQNISWKNFDEFVTPESQKDAVKNFVNLLEEYRHSETITNRTDVR